MAQVESTVGWEDEWVVGVCRTGDVSGSGFVYLLAQYSVLDTQYSVHELADCLVTGRPDRLVSSLFN